MREMLTIVTGVRSVCLSVSLSVTQLNCVWCIRSAFAKLLWRLVMLSYVLLTLLLLLLYMLYGQVTYQLKILTTAVLSVIMLRKQLSGLQWVSLVLLFIGVAAVNVQATTSHSPPSFVAKQAVEGAAKLVTAPPTVAVVQRPIVGFIAVVTACCLSGFAGVYFEKILKSTPQSIFVRNIQLGVVGMVLGLGAVYITDRQKVAVHGFFFGYDMAVWSVIMLHAFGGIVIAVVVKYADNILKGFASSAAIIISCIVSMYIFDFVLTTLFVIGATLVIIATYMYSKFAPKPVSSSDPVVSLSDSSLYKLAAPEQFASVKLT